MIWGKAFIDGFVKSPSAALRPALRDHLRRTGKYAAFRGICLRAMHEDRRAASEAFYCAV